MRLDRNLDGRLGHTDPAVASSDGVYARSTGNIVHNICSIIIVDQAKRHFWLIWRSYGYLQVTWIKEKLWHTCLLAKQKKFKTKEGHYKESDLRLLAMRERYCEENEVRGVGVVSSLLYIWWSSWCTWENVKCLLFAIVIRYLRLNNCQQQLPIGKCSLCLNKNPHWVMSKEVVRYWVSSLKYGRK